MRVLLPGVVERPNEFGGQVGTSFAALDDATVESLKMTSALERFARQLIAQANVPGRQFAGRVYGVELHSIEIQLVLSPRPNYCETCDVIYSSTSTSQGRGRCESCMSALIFRRESDVVQQRTDAALRKGGVPKRARTKR